MGNNSADPTNDYVERVVYAENQLREKTDLFNDLTGQDKVADVLVALIERGALD